MERRWYSSVKALKVNNKTKKTKKEKEGRGDGSQSAREQVGWM